jgi:hypothetical protein
MNAFPEPTAVATPVPDVIVAIVMSPEVQVPPETALVNVVTSPSHIIGKPAMDATGLTVIVLIEKHPVGTLYVIRTVPALTPTTRPVVEPTVATETLLLLHVLPATAGATLRAMVSPTHTVELPVTGGGTGRGLTVTTAVTTHVPTV